MIEESLVAGDVCRLGTLRRVVHEAQRGQSALRSVDARDIAALDTDGVSGESKANRRDARETLCRPAIRCQSIGRIGLVPEPVEGAALQCIEERRLSSGKSRRQEGAARAAYASD